MKQLKHLRQTLWRVLLCLTVAITCRGSASAWTFTSGTKLYFKISNNTWKNDCAKFIANFNNNNTLQGTRQSLTSLGNDYFSCDVPGNGGFDCVELLGMYPNTTDDAASKYYSNNFNYGPNDNQNCLELASNGGSNINLSWTTYNGSSVVDPPVVTDSPFDYYLHVAGDNYSKDYKFNYDGGKYSLTTTESLNGKRFKVVICAKGTVLNEQYKNCTWYGFPNDNNKYVNQYESTYSLATGDNTHDINVNQNDNYKFVLTLNGEYKPTSVNITSKKAWNEYRLKYGNNGEQQ
jgi:hypothetical protein